MDTNEPWIETYTGRRFQPLAPRAEDVCIEDIAHALALKTRFTGHCSQFYSIGQHCVEMATVMGHPGYLIPEQYDRRELALIALMHDAAEAYLPDVAAPIKEHLKGFKAVELMVESAIANAFRLPVKPPKPVKVLDYRMLLTEARDLMRSGGIEWETHGLHPLDIAIQPWGCGTAEREFLAMFHQLQRRDAENPEAAEERPK